MIFLFILIFFIFGLCIGSFLNVVIYRLNTKRSLSGRSACLSCQNKLRWHELIPLFSFFTLRGRCRSCRTKISIQYPLVEFATGLIFILLFLKLQNLFFLPILIFAVTYLYYAVMFSLLLVIAIYDLRHKIIPDALSLIFGLLAFAGLFFFNNSEATLFYWHIPAILEFLSGPLIALPFYLFWFISGGAWMGLGDAKLVLGLGWLFGFSGALSALAIAFWSGAIVGLFLMIFSKRYKMKSEIPFAPYMVLGAFFAFLFDLNLFSISF